MDSALAARVRDPVWLLARQWQVGEFQGEDAGSPVGARLRAEQSALSRYLPGLPPSGPVTGQPLAGDRPLEATVESEPVVDLRAAAEAGLAFFALLEQHGVGSYRPKYLELKRYGLAAPDPEVVDSATRRWLSIVAPRAPDGAVLYTDLAGALRPSTGAPALPQLPAVDPQDVTPVTSAATTWLDRYAGSFGAVTGTGAWQPERLEYAFALGARTTNGELALVAGEHDGGHLDWPAFDVDVSTGLGAGADAPPEEIVRTVLPGRVGYPGMPSPRWWEFEDARVDFGAVDAGAEELARMLLLEFALVYGNDFFAIPVDLPVGSVCRVRSLVVTDTFGERTMVEHVADVDGPTGAWRMFEPSPVRAAGAPTARHPLLVLAPTASRLVQGQLVEEVRLLRDEMANMAWAVERRVDGPAGWPVERSLVADERRAAEDAATPVGAGQPPAATLHYRIAAPVPDNWYPLLPVRVGGRSTALRLGKVATSAPSPAPPQGRLLAFGSSNVFIHEEEVPREGAQLTRAWHQARWSDGSTHVWIGRRRRPGRGEGSSGVRFDSAEPQ